MTDHEELIQESANFVGDLVYQLGNSYDELYGKGIDVEQLALALDALSYVNNKLQSQIEKIAKHNQEMLSKVSENN